MDNEPPLYLPYIALADQARIEARAKVGDKTATIEHEGHRYRFWNYGAGGEPWYQLVEGAAIEAAKADDLDAYLPGSQLSADELAEWAEHGVFTRDGRPYTLWQQSNGGQPWFRLVRENLPVAADAEPAAVMAAAVVDDPATVEGEDSSAFGDWWRSLWGAGDES